MLGTVLTAGRAWQERYKELSDKVDPTPQCTMHEEGLACSNSPWTTEHAAVCWLQVMAVYSAHVKTVMPELPLVKRKWCARNKVGEVLSRLNVEEDGALCFKDGSPSRHYRCTGLQLVTVRARDAPRQNALCRLLFGCGPDAQRALWAW